jgi:hypothetical protein
MPAVTPEREQIERLVRGEHHEPHRLLGAHLDGNQVTIRAWRPDRRRRDVADGRERERDRSDDEAGQPQDRGVTDRDRRDLGGTRLDCCTVGRHHGLLSPPVPPGTGGSLVLDREGERRSVPRRRRGGARHANQSCDDERLQQPTDNPSVSWSW